MMYRFKKKRNMFVPRKTIISNYVRLKCNAYRWKHSKHLADVWKKKCNKMLGSKVIKNCPVVLYVDTQIREKKLNGERWNLPSRVLPCECLQSVTMSSVLVYNVTNQGTHSDDLKTVCVVCVQSAAINNNSLLNRLGQSTWTVNFMLITCFF